MKRNIVSLILIFSFLMTNTSNSASAIKVGSKCNKLMEISIVGGYKYTCIKSGIKLVWGKKIKIGAGEVPVSITRSTIDRPDLTTGFVIKPVYVVPKGEIDNNYDTNGYISGSLAEGVEYIKSEIGRTVQIDKTKNGYDIQFLQSKYTLDELSWKNFYRTGNSSAGDGDIGILDLLKELGVEPPKSLPQKLYIFFIDTTHFGGTAEGDGSCGFGFNFSGSWVATKPSTHCSGYKYINFKDNLTNIWVHEMLHNFGVQHVKEANICDLMNGDINFKGLCPLDGKMRMDKDKKHYVGSNNAGVNILDLPVWVFD